MGMGMMSMSVGLRLQRNQQLQHKFRGAVMGCPSLVVDLPSKPVQSLLRNLVVPLFKYRQMPAFLSSSSNSAMSWSVDLSDAKQREYAEMVMRDCVGRFPGQALGWHQNMNWGTAAAFSTLYSHVEEDMTLVSFPFLVIHDRMDKVCFFSGSERLMEL